jgi:hypothetical protein
MMRHIRIRRCPHVDNSDDVHVAMSAGTNRPDRVFALLYLPLHMSSRSIAGVGGRRKKRSTLGLANAIAAGELLERGERARPLWTLDSGLLPVAISSNISRMVHLGQFGHRMRNW